MRLVRRDVLRSGAMLALGAVAGTSLLDHARAWAAEQPFAPEPGAELRFLRWGKFLDAEEQATLASIEAFSQATGVAVRVDSEWQDDIQTKAAVAANMDAGPDIIWALHTTPHLFPDKLVDLSDVASYLGQKYGGWYPIIEQYGKSGDRWIGIPSIVIGNELVYRRSHLEQAGFEAFPDRSDGFLELCRKLKANGTPAGFSFGKAPNDGNCWVHWLMWSHGGRLVDERNNVAILSAETEAALDYAKAIHETFVAGTTSWNDASNNKAFLAGEVSLTNNSPSIYGKARADGLEMAEDIDHALWPVGPVGEPTEMQLIYPMIVYKHTKYPNAAKALITYFMEAPQYDNLLQNSAGYITQTLKAFEANPVWESDPRIAIFKDCTARARSIAYAGGLGYSAAAALAEFIVADMFAEVVSGQGTAKEAMEKAQKRAERYYRI
jgi:multiple sugar transport system substrate-binding protein